MTKEDFLDRIIKLWGPDAPGLVPNLSAIAELFEEESPEYKFALHGEVDDAFLPTRAEPKATGWDVKVRTPNKEPLIITPFQHIKIPLGFRAFCPEGWWLKLHPRSSSFAKKHLHALYGVIDEGFEGEMVFACQYIPEFSIVRQNERIEAWIFGYPMPKLTIDFGDAIGQLIPIKRQEMKVSKWTNEEYNNACKERNGVRKDGGFGSTTDK